MLDVPSSKLSNDYYFPNTEGNWKVFITTGDTENAGIEANVSMTVYGTEGTSKPLPLGQEGQPTKMETGQTQEFEVSHSWCLRKKVMIFKYLNI